VKDKPHWTELCQQASVEQDPERLLQLIKEINRLLDEKEIRLRQERASEPLSEEPKDSRNGS
jgi:hypothetical protein